LDAIATGEQEWQTYLIGWNREYFGPAIAKAKSQLLSLPTFSEHPAHLSANGSEIKPIPPSPNPLRDNHQNQMPHLRRGDDQSPLPLQKDESQAFPQMLWGALHHGHVLECQGQTLRTAPRQRQALNPERCLWTTPARSAEHLLERYGYTKDGQDKVMLRCSILDNRRGKCKEVAYFQSRGEFWSPKFGTLKLPQHCR
jgi:DNA topoisomerase-1